jgi:hypothetical protein
MQHGKMYDLDSALRELINCCFGTRLKRRRDALGSACGRFSLGEALNSAVNLMGRSGA